MSEKKQLLLISINKKLFLEIREHLSLQFDVVHVESIHAGYSVAMDLMPDLIFIDNSPLGCCGDTKNIPNFRSTHFLAKSWLFMLIPDEAYDDMVKSFGEVIDDFILKSTPLDSICDMIISKVNENNSLSNYWKDCFMGMFNSIRKPVLLLEQNNVLALNDEFRQLFRPGKTTSHKLTDFVKAEDRSKLEANLRNFSRGKYMRESMKTGLLLNNNKTRNATIHFSKLKRGLDNQFIITIDFSGPEYLDDKIEGLQPTAIEECVEGNNTFCDCSFTKREKEIIKLLCKGYKTKEISSTLFISTKTIEKHRSNIIKKTNSDTMLESIIYAINHNLVEVGVS
ncbi:response regulator transcription factor [Autumnicola edwardsiae]|uniref:LuxR C-terminal-related transcriptional regulator n=1 Tax=Autumnicola edwardsiae TaxID=3075594 RepID=A0ABU3CZ57_9FLAO|nr:LuxR C-terminal-related transcriptional regulator [Zunongwangia sp. F297]MDT0651624.1 LuxR C-terminal-related transcriptional regulator [Zunongwangia sp. F297]